MSMSMPLAAEVDGRGMRGAECEITGNADSCTPFYACVSPAPGAGTDALHAKGRAIGSDRGTIEAVLSNGVTCSGRWRTLAGGEGVVDLDCDDGRTVSAEYRYIDPKTGTAVAVGSTSRGERVDAWAGRFVDRFLRDRLDDTVTWRGCAALVS